MEQAASAAVRVYPLICRNREERLFERQFPTPQGMTYNSYVVCGGDPREVAVIDTADPSVADQWHALLTAALHAIGAAGVRFLVVQHLEPDHTAGIDMFMSEHPETTLLCTATAGRMLPKMLDCARWASRVRPVKEAEKVSLGQAELQFFAAPMVHWPEVMVTYEASTATLFSADAFGTFGAEMGREVVDTALEEWVTEARRYYANICGKFGQAVQSLLGKAGRLPQITMLRPLHGPSLTGEAITTGLDFYNKWSLWQSDAPWRVLIAVDSFHGHTLAAARHLQCLLEERGAEAVLVDLTTDRPTSEAVGWAWSCGTAVFMAPTYDAGLASHMVALLEGLGIKGWRNRRVALVENGTWAPLAARLMKGMLTDKCQGLEFLEPVVTVHSRLDEASRAALATLADNIVG